MSDNSPLALSDNQMDAVLQGAQPLPPSLLHGVEIGDGVVSRVCAQAQRELFRAPVLFGGAGEPKPLRKLQRSR
jgi:hypothetical protein